MALIRHGETENSVKKLFQHDDCKLTDSAIAEARMISRAAKNWKYDLAISSTLKRSIDTTRLLLDKDDFLKTSLVNEFGEPKSIQGLQISSDLSYLDKVIKNFNNDPFFSIEDGESLGQFWQRINKFAYIMRNLSNANKIVVVSHAMFIRCFAKYCEVINPSRKMFTKARIMALGKLRASVFEISNGLWVLKRWNVDLNSLTELE